MCIGVSHWLVSGLAPVAVALLYRLLFTTLYAGHMLIQPIPFHLISIVSCAWNECVRLYRPIFHSQRLFSIGSSICLCSGKRICFMLISHTISSIPRCQWPFRLDQIFIHVILMWRSPIYSAYKCLIWFASQWSLCIPRNERENANAKLNSWRYILHQSWPDTMNHCSRGCC